MLASCCALAEPPALVTAMLSNAPVDAASRCGYTRQTFRDDNSKLERFDLTGGKAGWTLLSVDGQPPRSKTLRNYADRAEDRLDRQHPLEFDLRDRVEPDSWVLVSETEDEAVFSFRLRLDEEDDIDVQLLDKISSTLTLDRRREQPTRVLIQSTGPASLAPLVRISDYRQEYVFEWNDAVGAAVLTEKISRRRGTAMGFRSLNKDKRVLYGDFECTVYAAELPREMPVEN